jgi:hypothetical protein
VAKNRSFYVSIDDENSIMYDLFIGTIKGLILGPRLILIVFKNLNIAV